ncbi:acyl-CoA thioesterase [Chelatococcus reniformis]|uniref:Acyl-CoA thioesterase n=1 Tax=Chelatococcus reniformis TaxID=1494448 RepID=A0A916U1X1_9HYPH|nr:acyl-CoA thioesterase [Chelatococcus reniformis]
MFRVNGESVLASPLAAGPWDLSMQHGSAPSSLAIWAAERMETAVPMQVARLTVDLMRPVPIGELELKTEVLRAGRKIQLCGVRLLAKGVEVVRASVLKIRRTETPLPGDAGAVPPLDLQLPDACEPMDPEGGIGNPFITGLSARTARGGFRQPGPGAVWFRVDRTIVEGSPVSQAMRAAIASDFSNGVSSVLDFRHWTFINGDLTVSLAREPVGDWILLNAQTWLGPDGAGIAAARLGDVTGYFGRAVQSLVVEPRG